MSNVFCNHYVLQNGFTKTAFQENRFTLMRPIWKKESFMEVLLATSFYDLLAFSFIFFASVIWSHFPGNFVWKKVICKLYLDITKTCHESSLVICKKCMGISKITLLAGTLIVLCAISRGHLCHSVVCIWCFKWQVKPFSHRKVAHIPKASGTQNVRHNFFGIIVAIKAG